MSALGKTITILRSSMITSWAFCPDALRVKLCGILPISISYSDIQDCVLRPFHNRLRIASESEDWHILKAGILTARGTVYVLACEDAQGFIAALHNHAPQVQVRQIDEKAISWEWPT